MYLRIYYKLSLHYYIGLISKRFFFINNTFLSNTKAETGKKIKQKLKAKSWGWTVAIWKLFAFFIYATLSSKNNRKYSKKCTKNKYVCLKEVKPIWLMSMKMRLKTKNRSRRYDINRPKPRHGHKYTKYKKCLRILNIDWYMY